MVASRVDGIAELLEDGQDACLLPLDRQDLFVREVCRLLRNKRLSRRLARSGREKVQRSYSAESFVAQVEDLYLKYLEGGTRRKGFDVINSIKSGFNRGPEIIKPSPPLQSSPRDT